MIKLIVRATNLYNVYGWISPSVLQRRMRVDPDTAQWLSDIINEQA